VVEMDDYVVNSTLKLLHLNIKKPPDLVASLGRLL